MLNKKIEQAINKQINAELWSAYLYLSMSAYFERSNLAGFANWMHIQAQEELTHAMRFYTYIVNRGGQVSLTTIDAPPTTWKSPLHVFEETLKHEQIVTSKINTLVDLATKEQDHASQNMLQWFVNEQVEEENSADQIVQKLRLIGNDGGGLFMMDRELGQRVFTPPATNNET